MTLHVTFLALTQSYLGGKRQFSKFKNFPKKSMEYPSEKMSENRFFIFLGQTVRCTQKCHI